MSEKSVKEYKVSIYTRNSERGPSDYYRVVQYIQYMKAHCVVHNAIDKQSFTKNLSMCPGIKKKMYQGWLLVKIYKKRIHDFIIDLKMRPDVIIVQRECIPHCMGVFASYLLKKVTKRCRLIWDFDDDIFLNNEISNRERKILEMNSYRIVVTSEYLKNALRDDFRKKTICLPTTDGFCKRYDINKLTEYRKQRYNKELRLVWVGTQSNLVNLDSIVPELDNAAKTLLEKHNKELILTVVCNNKLCVDTGYLRINNVIWTRKDAENAIAEAHVGVMPLIENEYALGKGGFKLIQYISVGLPVLASDVGFNREIVSGDEGELITWGYRDKWSSAIVNIGTNEQIWSKMSKAATKRYEESYSIENNCKFWKGIINNSIKKEIMIQSGCDIM